MNIPSEKMVYRCDGCRGVLYARHIAEGGCPVCGCRRVQIATSMTDEELNFLKEEGYEYDASNWMDKEEAVEKQRMEREVRL